MTVLTIQVSDELAERIEPLGEWLSTIIELGLLGFKTTAAATVSEVVEFLAANPSPHQVLDYHVSSTAQQRLERLLTLNEAGLLAEEEQLVLDELQQLEHVLIMLKARVQEQLQEVAL